jgi:protein TonB
VSYAQRRPIGASRTFAIAIVALTQASLGYAIVTGLAFTPIHKAHDGLKTFNVEEVQAPPELPPPEVPPPKPKEAPKSEPPVVSPPTPTNADALRLMFEAPPSVTGPAAAPVPPAPSYPSQPSSAPPVMEQVPPRSAKGDLQSLFRSADYPIAALERREQGSVSVRMTVGVTGLVTNCAVTSSSGSRTLDEASCRILQSRALFTPARDSGGNVTTDTVRQEIRWVLRST